MNIDEFGFTLLLQDFCAYCPDFEPEVEKINRRTSFDDPLRCYTNIRCQNRIRCARIAENLEGRLKDERKHDK